MSSGGGASASAGPGTPVGGVPPSGGDPFGPLIASLNALDSTLAGFAQNITVTAVLDSKQFDATIAAFSKQFDTTLTGFSKSFDTTLASFIGKFTTAFDASIAKMNIGGGKGGGGKGGGGKGIPNDRIITRPEASEFALKNSTKSINTGMVTDITVVTNAFVESIVEMKASALDLKKLVSEGLENRGYGTKKAPKAPKAQKTQMEIYTDTLIKDDERRKVMAFAKSQGKHIGPLNTLNPRYQTSDEKGISDFNNLEHRREAAIKSNELRRVKGYKEISLPGDEKGESGKASKAGKGFDWKGMAGGVGLGLLFGSVGAGIGLLAAKILGPSFKKAFDPLMKAAEDTASALDPLAESINTSLTPFREFGNEVKRWSIVAGMKASLNMKRTNAEAGGNLNADLAEMAGKITGIFTKPMTGIMDAANLIGKFVEMADPAAMAVWNQTMKDTFAVIGNALAPALIKLSSMLRMFADEFNVVLQNAVPIITTALASLAKAFQDNLPNIILLMERYVNDLVKMVGGTGGGEDWKMLKRGHDEFVANGMKEKEIKDAPFANFLLGNAFNRGMLGAIKGPKGQASNLSDSYEFARYAENAHKISGRKGKFDDPENIKKTLKAIEAGLGNNKAPSTVGMARPENAAYNNVAEVGREAVRRAFEGSRQQDLVRQQNREDIQKAIVAAVLEINPGGNQPQPIFQNAGPNNGIVPNQNNWNWLRFIN